MELFYWMEFFSRGGGGPYSLPREDMIGGRLHREIFYAKDETKETWTCSRIFTLIMLTFIMPDIHVVVKARTGK